MDDILNDLAAAIGNLNENEVVRISQIIAQSHPDEAAAAVQALSRGMDVVGKKFDFLEYFVGDLIYAGEIFTAAMRILSPCYDSAPVNEHYPKILLATVEGDLHDIGKNIVGTVLESKGFPVIDMGVNVSPDVIASKAKEENIQIVALSAVLTYAIQSMKRTIEALEEAGIRDRVKVVIGGAAVNETTVPLIGADAYGETPEDTAAYCLSLTDKEVS